MRRAMYIQTLLPTVQRLVIGQYINKQLGQTHNFIKEFVTTCQINKLARSLFFFFNLKNRSVILSHASTTLLPKAIRQV